MFSVVSKHRTFKTLKYINFRKFSNVPPRSTINTVGVVGGGQMGMGIGITTAIKTNKKVIVYDNNEQGLNKSLEFITGWMTGQVKKGKIEENHKNDTLSRVTCVTNFDSLKSCDYIIEAVTENESVKENIFTNLNNLLPEDVILCSNTSSIPITKIQGWIPSRSDKVCGMHFMNPVPVMKLVELIPGLNTSSKTLEIVQNTAQEMGKETTVSRDEAGFIANRILMPYINEAIITLQEGTGSIEDIDKTMKLGTNVPMGPLTLADFIGLDTCLFVQKVLHQSLGDKYRPATLLERYVECGWLGKKTKRGFYDYSSGVQKVPQAN